MVSNFKLSFCCLCLVGSWSTSKAAEQQIFSSGTIDKVFPARGTDSHTITVDADFVICDVDIEVDISHSWISEIEFHVGLDVDGPSSGQPPVHVADLYTYDCNGGTSIDLILMILAIFPLMEEGGAPQALLYNR